MELKTNAKQVIISFVSKSGNAVSAYGVDLGYTVKILTFDYSIIAELLDVTPRQLADVFRELQKPLDLSSKGDRLVTPIVCIKS